MAYDIETLRLWVRQFARNATDSNMYPNDQIDRAIQLAGDEWMRITRYLRALSTADLTIGSSATPTLPAGWAPEYSLNVYMTLAGQVSPPELQFVSYEEVLARRAMYGTGLRSGQPHCFGLLGDGTGIFDSIPDQAYTMNFWWWKPFTSWTPGSDPAPNSFNVPDEHLRVIATYGAPAILQHTEPEHAYASDSWKTFMEKAKVIAGRNAGGRGGSVSYKDDTRPSAAWFPVG